MLPVTIGDRTGAGRTAPLPSATAARARPRTPGSPPASRGAAPVDGGRRGRRRSRVARSSKLSSGYRPTPTLPKWLCASRAVRFRHRHLGPQRRRDRRPARADEPTAPCDTAHSTPTVTVGPGSWSRCRTRVRTLRAPAGRVLVRSAGRDSACAGTRPDSVSRTSWRCARAARTLRQGSLTPRTCGVVTAVDVDRTAEQPRRQRR